jgi:hypothetical protein
MHTHLPGQNFMKLSKNKTPWGRKMSIPVANMAVRRKVLSKLYTACGQLP